MESSVIGISVRYEPEKLAEIYRDVTCEIRVITPSAAAALLEKNIRNRTLNKRHYQGLSQAMRSGEYVLNGETVVIDSDGNLLDGQHRLHACIDAGKSFVTLVINGIDPAAFDTVDNGRSRTNGDVLSSVGESSANQVAGAVNQFIQFVDCGGNMGAGTAGRGRKATPRLVGRILGQHPGIRDSVAAMKRCSLYRNQQSYVLHYLFSCVSTELAEDFASVMADGSRDAGRPFNLFRESMIRGPVSPSTRRQFAAKCVKAFNAERAGERPKMFRFSDGEEFPTIGGLDYEWLASTAS